MQCRLGIIPLAVSITVLANFRPAASADEPERVTRFLVSIDSKIDTHIEGLVKQTIPLQARSDILYAWSQKGPTRSLSITSMKVESTGKGVTTTNYLDRSKMIDIKDGKRNEVTAENMPEGLRNALQVSFGEVVFVSQRDAEGKESNGELKAKPGLLIDKGMVANCSLFHPPFPKDQNNWIAERAVSTGPAGEAQGKLAYAVDKEENGRIIVSVNGKLRAERLPSPQLRSLLTTTEYVVQGTQTFDRKKGEWVQGRANVQVIMTMEQDGRLFANGTGTMILSFSEIKEK